MLIQQLDADLLQDFLNYCRTYRLEHDESYLCEDDLLDFQPETDYCLVAIDNAEKIIGVFSLMKNYRVRIFHCAEQNLNLYGKFHRAMMKILPPDHPKECIHCFIPSSKEGVIEALKSLGYLTERFVFVMTRNHLPAPEAVFPNDFTLKSVRFPEDIGFWADIRNSAFKDLLGTQFHDVEYYENMNRESDHRDDLCLMLRHRNIPVGIIRAVKDEQPDGMYGFIGPIAVLEEYRGRGLGRNMLREILNRIHTHPDWKASLCVNGENEDALQLYLQEGFRIIENVQSLLFPILF